MPKIEAEKSVDTLAILLEEKKKGILFLKKNAACSVSWGAMLVFSLLRGSVRCLCLTETVSLHRVPVGSTPAMTGGRAMGEQQQKKSDSR